MIRLLACTLLVVLAAVTVEGCVTDSSSARPSSSSGPRARCLSNPNETGGMRPLVFLFCAESP